jgi:hypothetical protein
VQVAMGRQLTVPQTLGGGGGGGGRAGGGGWKGGMFRVVRWVCTWGFSDLLVQADSEVCRWRWGGS